MNFLISATELAELGFHVFPLAHNSKIPAIAKRDGGRGCLDATADPIMLHHWAQRFPRANVGIGTGSASGVIVVDLDPKNGAIESLARLKSEGKRFPETVCVRTARGGWHLYFAYEPGISNSSGKIAPGVDVRSDRGYVVAPLSVAHGAQYRWINPPAGKVFKPLPGWASEALRPKPRPVVTYLPKANRTRITHLFDFVATAPEGRRNGSLFWAACRIAEQGLLGRAAMTDLLDAAIAAGLPSFEAEKTIDSALRISATGRAG